MLLAVVMIFCGGATEAMMSQWSSSYLEVVMGIPKVVGDILGVALFGAMLSDKKKIGDSLRFVFLADCGRAVVEPVDPAEIRSALPAALAVRG